MRLTIIALVATLTLASCTPEQLATYHRETGIRLDASLVDLPDVPIRLADGREVMPDGSVTPTPVAPAGSKCPQHYGAALGAGWAVTDWPKLDRIMYRESRCNASVVNNNARTKDASRGLTQLNLLAHRGWISPLVGGDFDRLYDPGTNLRVARVLYDRCGWGPWTKPYWCAAP